MADVSDIFYFFLLGEGKGESEAAGRGVGLDILLKIPEGGGGLQLGRRAREGVCGELGIWGGGGLNFFFSGPKCPPRKSQRASKMKVTRSVEERAHKNSSQFS